MHDIDIYIVQFAFFFVIFALSCVYFVDKVHFQTFAFAPCYCIINHPPDKIDCWIVPLKFIALKFDMIVIVFPPRLIVA